MATKSPLDRDGQSDPADLNSINVLQLEIDRGGFAEEARCALAVSPIPDETVPGGIGGVLARVHAIPDAIRENRTILQAAFASMAEAVFIADAEGRLIDFSEEFVRYHRFQSREQCSRTIAECPHSLEVWLADGTPAPLDQWALPRALRGETASNVEYRLQSRLTGETWWGSYNFAPIRDRHGNIIGAVVAGREVTERKQAEAALRASEKRLRALLEASSDVIYRMSPDWSEMRHLVGRDFIADTTEPNRTWLHKYIHPQDQPQVLAVIDAAIHNKRIFELEHRVLRVDGSLGWTFSRAVPILDAADAIVEWFGTASDITERKRAEQQLRESEARLQAVLDGSPDPVFLKDREGRLLLANPATFAVIGRPAEACLGKTDEEFYDPPADGRIVMANDRAILASGQAEIVEEVVHTPSGPRHFVSHKAPYRDATGDIIGLIGVARDITERKQAELALGNSQQQLALALEAGQLGFWDWDVPSGRVHYGGRWAAMLGYAPAEIEPHVDTWAKLVHPDDLAPVTAILSDHLDGRTDFYESTHRMRHKDGSWRWILNRGQVVERDTEGRPLRATGTHADVTARREAELALQEADRRKDEFLATLAHELRNPLAPIRNTIQALRMTLEPNPTAERLLAMMERQVTYLVRLVDDLLEISRITRGKIELRKERVDLGTIIGHAVEISRPFIDAGRHRLEVVPPAKPVLLEADPVRLTQVLANLLNNAAKYTEPGGTIRVMATRQGSVAVVSVRDSGVGIVAELLPQVFDLFIQSGRHLERAQGGLGIGLALVRRLVEMHGGTVAASSAGPGQGSEFVVRLPALAESGGDQVTAVRGEAAVPPGAPRVLIVDDNTDGADSLSQLLTLLGYETRTAYDGEQGVLEAEHFHPDIILLDLGMPKLDGHTACRRIREQPWGRGIVIMALTGWGQDKDRRRTREAGFDAHLAKPIDTATLIRTINSLLADNDNERIGGG
jgi:PAS domain S-box-containing protein